MDNLNLVIMGKTGAGKSTLINAILGEKLAPVGSGQAVTKENKIYTKSTLLPLGEDSGTGQYGMVGKKLNLYDTVGLEIDSAITRKTLEEIKKYIISAQHSEKEHDITLVWFCVNCRSSRFEKYELELIRELSNEYEIPFVIVVTQCYSEEKGELEQQVEKDLPEINIVRILAKEYKTRGGTVSAFGIDCLLRTSVIDYEKNKVRILENKLDMLSQNKEQIIANLRSKGMRCIESYGDKALKIGFVPVGCIPFVHGLCIKMLMDLNGLVGINSAKGFATDIFADAVVGLIATPFMGVPLLSAAVATGYVQSVGETYLDALMSVIGRSSDSELKNNDVISRRIRDELKKHKG
ncbi:GTPase domain-containing protein [Lachnospiraceae bacterium OttesenSCG-928-D06]|nr:GTPase domain-containing protein [Lachnospiraceae bacterium OttesenSCG-928-D06]